MKRKAAGKVRVLVVHGVNLDLLGTREPEVYGKATLADIDAALKKNAAAVAELAGLGGIELKTFQTNDESALLAELSKPCDGVVINPGAWTHTSLALADRLKGLGVPYVEVHLSNVAAREEFRRHSFTAPSAAGCVHGFGAASYLAGLYGLCLKLYAPS